MSISIIACVLFVILIYISVHYLSKKKTTKGHIPSLDDIPGPKGIPFLGNVGDFFNSQVHIWDIIRKRALKYYPIYKLKFLNQYVVSVLDPKDVEMILTDTTAIKGPMYAGLKEIFGNGLIVSEGEIWRQRRKKMSKSFHFSFLSVYVSIFNKTADLFIRQLRNHIMEPIDVLPKMGSLTLKVVCGSIAEERCKLDESEIMNYIESGHTMSEAFMFRGTKPYLKYLYNFTDMKQRETNAIKTMQTFTNNVYDVGLKALMHEDENNLRLMNVMLKNPEVFKEKDIKNEITTFLFAGQDTTACALSFILMVLANYPKYQDEIRQEMVEIGVENGMASFSQLKEMKLLDRFLKEFLRLYPPAVFIARTLTQDIVTKTGYLLPAETIVMIPIFDIHRNPNLYPNPDKFDADRFLPDNIQIRHPFAFIPFSAGHRNCIAQKFAKLEIKAVICRILDKFVLKPVTKIDEIVFRFDAVLQNKDEIQVKFIPR